VDYARLNLKISSLLFKKKAFHTGLFSFSRVAVPRMFILRSSTYVLAIALCLLTVHGKKHRNHTIKCGHSLQPGATNRQSLFVVNTKPAPLKLVTQDNVKFSSNTSSAVAVNAKLAGTVTATKVNSTALVIARDQSTAYTAYSGLNDHGIPYYLLTVPQGGVALPTLNDSTTVGNYGLIVVLSEVSYDYGSDGYRSALTQSQWTSLYNYQIAFGVRMVRLDAYPSDQSGTKALGACCDTGVEQYVAISSDKYFPTAGLKIGATLSTSGLYHYPASIPDSSTTTEIAQFKKNSVFPTDTTAAVVNSFLGGRQQMVFFMPSATDWSLTSALLQHAWINWATRGLYVGQRRASLQTQVDDMFLITSLYSPEEDYRIGTSDLSNHITFTKKLNAKMNSGSQYFIEVGHNGNGNIEQTDDQDDTGEVCPPGPIEYPDQIDTPLEFSKPAGSGTSLWPSGMGAYANYSENCLEGDDLQEWWAKASNLNAFAHVSHTFTHEDQNNATYSDVVKEISWNKGWLAATGISKATKFSGQGLIPPAITGLHNPDALKAWSEAGITNAMGDNTRPVLLNKMNEHWPLITTVADNGYAGMQITPRWATSIYYNCNTPDCTVLEWINTSAGKGNINDLLELEKRTNVRHLLTLHHDPFMFHQANMMYTDAPNYKINGVTAQLSLLEAWLETIVQEFVRLVKWPLITYKQDDIALNFRKRMTRDRCYPNLLWNLDVASKTITGVTITTAKMTCSEAIPVAFPGTVTDTQGFTTEQVGSDPLTIWVVMSGKPVSFTLTTPIAV